MGGCGELVELLNGAEKVGLLHDHRTDLVVEVGQMGCDELQGFLFAKPLQADAMGPLLRRGPTGAATWPDGDDSRAGATVRS